MSEVQAEGRRVTVPFAKGWLVPREEITLSKLPDIELRVKHAETGEIYSEFFKLSLKLTPAEAKTVDLAMAVKDLGDWLKRRYDKEYTPQAKYKSWESMAKYCLLPFLFADRLKHERPPKTLQSMLEAGPGHTAPQLKLHLNYGKNFYIHSTYYSASEEERAVENGPEFAFESSYDGSIHYDGAIGGFASVFGTRQVVLVKHRFINLQANFDYEGLCVWAENRVDTLLPGVVTKGLITDFKWLPKGKFFGGDEPRPFLAHDARRVADQHKEAE